MTHLTLAEVFNHPERATSPLQLANNEALLLRPLVHDDAAALALFLEGLSPTTRRFSVFASYDMAMAQTLCDAINRYDKLRLVVARPTSGHIVGLMEFSFDIPEGDMLRYAQHGETLNGRFDCRFGPTIADAYQNQGLGSRVFPHLVELAQQFGKRRIILWGGVLADNGRAIRFYQKQGFVPVGMFEEEDSELLFDMLLEIEMKEGEQP